MKHISGISPLQTKNNRNGFISDGFQNRSNFGFNQKLNLITKTVSGLVRSIFLDF